MHLRTVCSTSLILILMHTNICLATDWMYGAKDPIGMYPRIPDRDKLKKEIEFAEECRKYITAPSTRFY